VMEAGPDIYSGSEPHGEEAFRSLAKMGVKTVVSVDGARPQVELARKYGLRYVHIPIGYDGVDEAAGKSLARLVKEAKEPVYVHCHHGVHRGPAAAAVACIAAGHTDNASAQDFLKKAGTSPKYQGLWRDVAAYQPPADGAELPELVEIAKITSMAAAMAKIDRKYDNLKLISASRWRVPEDHPDLVAAKEINMMLEGFEAAIAACDDYPAEMKSEFATSVATAKQIKQILESTAGKPLAEANASAATQHLATLQSSCNTCHTEFRN